MTRIILQVAGAGLIALAGLGPTASIAEDKSRIERAGENCLENVRNTFSIDEETELEIGSTSRRSRDRTFLTVTVDVPGVGQREIRCQVNDRGDGIRRLRVFDEGNDDNNGWGNVDGLAAEAAVAAEQIAAEKAAEAAAAEAAAAAAAAAEAAEQEAVDGGDGGAGAGGGGTPGVASLPEGSGAARVVPRGGATPPTPAPATPAPAGDPADGAGGDATTAEAEEEAPSGPVFKRVQ
ncbi:MAG: hypothetical protein AAF577_17035 [Pseudomonadota bacterium]